LISRLTDGERGVPITPSENFKRAFKKIFNIETSESIAWNSKLRAVYHTLPMPTSSLVKDGKVDSILQAIVVLHIM
jgi:hypothetical protein